MSGWLRIFAAEKFPGQIRALIASGVGACLGHRLGEGAEPVAAPPMLDGLADAAATRLDAAVGPDFAR